MLAIEMLIENEIIAMTNPSTTNFGVNSKGGMAGGGNLRKQNHKNVASQIMQELT